jgi:hypothetical protein
MIFMRRNVILLKRTGRTADRFFAFFRGKNDAERLSRIISRGSTAVDRVAASSFRRAVRRKFIREVNEIARDFLPGLWVFREECPASNECRRGSRKLVAKNSMVRLYPLAGYEAVVFDLPTPDDLVVYMLPRGRSRFDELLVALGQSRSEDDEGRRFVPLASVFCNLSPFAKKAFARELDDLNKAVGEELAVIEMVDMKKIRRRKRVHGRRFRRVLRLGKNIFVFFVGQNYFSFSIRPKK